MLADELGVESIVGDNVVEKMSQSLTKMIDGAGKNLFITVTFQIWMELNCGNLTGKPKPGNLSSKPHQ